MPNQMLDEPVDEKAKAIDVAAPSTGAAIKKDAVVVAPVAPTKAHVPVTVVAEVDGRWRLEWKDAVGRLRQSWSSDRLETSTLSHLEGLPPHGDDIESVLVDICIPVSAQVATLHFMNIWEISNITYQAMRDLLASYGADEYIALEARVQALGAKANNPGG